MEKKTPFLKIFCDGGSRGNPGPAASAFVVIKDDKLIAKGSFFLGETTNNVAEYTSVIKALEWLKRNDDLVKEVVMNLDSQLIQRQLLGKYKIRNKKLLVLASKAKELEKGLSTKVFYLWKKRSSNKLADSLVNKELDKNLQRESVSR